MLGPTADILNQNCVRYMCQGVKHPSARHFKTPQTTVSQSKNQDLQISTLRRGQASDSPLLHQSWVCKPLINSDFLLTVSFRYTPLSSTNPNIVTQVMLSSYLPTLKYKVLNTCNCVLTGLFSSLENLFYIVFFYYVTRPIILEQKLTFFCTALIGTHELMSYLTNRICAINWKFKAYSHQSFLL